MRIRPHPTIVKKTYRNYKDYYKYVCAINVTNKRSGRQQAAWSRSRYSKYTICQQYWINNVKSAGSNIIRTISSLN